MKSTLRNLINARIPELLELKMGCEVLSEGRNAKIIAKRGIVSSHYCIIIEESEWITSRDCTELEIIGTSPSWSDYLRCLPSDIGIVAGQIISITPTGWYHICFDGSHRAVVVDLSKGPLEQSSETLQKLVDLIPPL